MAHSPPQILKASVSPHSDQRWKVSSGIPQSSRTKTPTRGCHEVKGGRGDEKQSGSHVVPHDPQLLLAAVSMCAELHEQAVPKHVLETTWLV